MTGKIEGDIGIDVSDLRLSRNRLNHNLRINIKKPSKAFQSLAIRG